MNKNSENPPSSTFFIKKREKNPLEKDQLLYNFLKVQLSQGIKQVSFHELQTSLKFSSGALQATITRCLKEDSPFKIYETASYSNKNRRLTRVFSVESTYDDPPAVSNLQKLLDI